MYGKEENHRTQFLPLQDGCGGDLAASLQDFLSNMRLSGSLKIKIATARSLGLALVLEKLLARRQAATFMQTVLIDMHAGVETCFIAFD